MCERWGCGEGKSIGLCVAQQETFSKGHRLLTACTLVCFSVCVCESMIFAQQRLCTDLTVNPVLARNTEEANSGLQFKQKA